MKFRNLLIIASALLQMTPLVFPSTQGLAASYVSQNGAFSADFPSTPAVTQKTDKTPVGAVGENIYQSQNRQGIFTVEYSIIPEVAVMFGGHQNIYKKAKEGFLNKSGDTEVSFNEAIFLGKPGAELVYTNAQGQTGKARFLLEGKRFYVIVAEGTQSKALDEFLNSFKLLP